MAKAEIGSASGPRRKANKIGGTIMANIEIKATKDMKDGSPVRESSIQYDFGENAADAIQRYGDDVVFSQFIAAAKITAQGAMRRMLEAGKTQEEITAKMADWKPGVALTREAVDPIQAALARFGTMDAEAQKEFMAQLRAKINK